MLLLPVLFVAYVAILVVALALGRAAALGDATEVEPPRW
jgi:hypothetical protein